MIQPEPLHVPDLQTQRLLLRRLQITDAAALFEILSDPETTRYWGRPAMTDLREAERYTQENLDWINEGRCLYWAVEEKASQKVIGTFALLRLNFSNRHGEVGYLLNRAWWSQGLMGEVMARVIQYAFEEMKLHRLEADTDPDNLASIKLLEKFGFEREGLFRDRWLVDGKWSDSLMLGLLSEVS